MLGRVGCTSSVFKQRCVSVKWLRSWIGLRTDMINRFLNQTFVRMLCKLSPLSPKKQRRTLEKSSQSQVHESVDVHMNVDAPVKTEGGKESEKGKDARSRHWSLLLVWR